MGFRLDHRFTQKNLSAYLDGRLTASERARVEEHLAECSHCQEELATLRSTVELLHATPSVPLPRSFELPASAEEERQRYRFWRRMHTMLRTATAAVSLLLILLLSGDLAISLGVVPLSKRAAETAPPGVMMQREVDEAPQAAEAYVPTPSPIAAAREIETDALPSPPIRMEAEESLKKEAPEMAERPAGGASPERAATQTAAKPEAKVLESERGTEAPATPTATLRPPTPTPSRTPKPTATMAPLPTRAWVSAEPARLPYWRIWGWVRTGWATLSGLLLVLVAGLLWTWQKRHLR